MSKLLKGLGVIGTGLGVVFLAMATNADQHKVDAVLAAVPVDARVTVEDRARHNQCDILKADLVSPCQQARKIMAESYFIFAYSR